MPTEWQKFLESASALRARLESQAARISQLEADLARCGCKPACCVGVVKEVVTDVQMVYANGLYQPLLTKERIRVCRCGA